MRARVAVSKWAGSLLPITGTSHGTRGAVWGQHRADGGRTCTTRAPGHSGRAASFSGLAVHVVVAHPLGRNHPTVYHALPNSRLSLPVMHGRTPHCQQIWTHRSQQETRASGAAASSLDMSPLPPVVLPIPSEGQAQHSRAPCDSRA